MAAFFLVMISRPKFYSKYMQNIVLLIYEGNKIMRVQCSLHDRRFIAKTTIFDT